MTTTTTMSKEELLKHSGEALRRALEDMRTKPPLINERVVAIARFDHEAKELYGKGGAQVNVGDIGTVLASTADQGGTLAPLVEWRTSENYARSFTGTCNMPLQSMVRYGHWKLIIEHAMYLLRLEIGVQEVRLKYTKG